VQSDLVASGEMLEAEMLNAEYRRRRRPWIEKSVPKGTETEGWSVLRELRTKTRLKRDKEYIEALEDAVWCFFYQLGVDHLSSRDYAIRVRQQDKSFMVKPISVMAIDGENVFAVGCFTSHMLEGKSPSELLKEYESDKPKIENALKKILAEHDVKLVHVLVTDGIPWAKEDKTKARKAGIQIWDEYDLYALQELASLAGEGARYQIYNRLFFGRKVKGFEVKVPAIEAKMGGLTYYTFSMSPEDLLKIAYIHQRSQEASFLELTDSYQRIIKKPRIRKIEDFIKAGGFFPGAIIINFHRPLLKKEAIGDKKHLKQMRQNSRPVALTLPPYYGCAWIVDGQHRLYGYADTEHKNSETVPVVAFVEQSASLEARMFVEVNQNQKSIEANLLWDLYEDLYVTSESEDELELYAISRIAKNLNSWPNSPFHGCIAIPKDQNTGNLTLTTVCSVIYNQRLVAKGEGFLFKGSYEETISYATERIVAFYDVIRSALPKEWDAGDQHYVRTNSGFVVLTGILKDVLECTLSTKEIENRSKFKNAVEKFLTPLLYHLLDCERNTIDAYRGAGGASQRSREVRAELTKVIRYADLGFRSIWLEQYEQVAAEEDKLEKRREGAAYYLKQLEGDELEFKGSLSLSIDRYLRGDGATTRDETVENEGVLKTIVGFLNAKGGEILIGVLERNKYEDLLEERLADCPQYNGKVIFGLELELGKGEWDGFQQRLTSIIETKIGRQVTYSGLVAITELKYEGKDLCLVKVQPSDTKQFLLGRYFYIRVGNKTVLLEGVDIDVYWKSR